LKVDMHVHTHGSFDCLSPPDAVLAFARKRGIDRLCITDHNEIDVALRMRDRHPDTVIVGEEVKTAERVDVIGLFLEERIPAGTPAAETCARIREQGGLVYLPHPFARGRGGGGRILLEIGDRIDIVEAFNARVHERVVNERAETWGRNAGIALGAGSDAHTPAEVGRAYVEVRRFAMEPAAFLDAVREGHVHGRTSSRLVHLASTWAKLRKRLGSGGRT
jgi:predicted metal-dependent phosphoesterase TrpH